MFAIIGVIFVPRASYCRHHRSVTPPNANRAARRISRRTYLKPRTPSCARDLHCAAARVQRMRALCAYATHHRRVAWRHRESSSLRLFGITLLRMAVWRESARDIGRAMFVVTRAYHLASVTLASSITSSITRYQRHRISIFQRAGVSLPRRRGRSSS